MEIKLTHTGKRFNRDWIFRDVNILFTSSHKYAIIGSNGSGKSTLLQIISGALLQSEGLVEFYINGKKIEDTSFYKNISIAAPYLDLIEEMTTYELLSFHHQFKPLTHPISQILEEVGLTTARNKEIRFFSSGMKQRLKLALAFFSDTSILLLDEPTTTLDQAGTKLYHELINKYSKDRLVIVSSNDEKEYSFCNQLISIESYK